MAQQNFLFDDDGRVISGINGNATSAITAGDLLYASPPSTSPFGTTVPGGVDYDEIEVESIKFATATLDTQGGRIVGVAMYDAAAGSQVSFATEGLFLSPVIDTTAYVAAGMPVRASEGTTTAGITNCGTTTGPTGSEHVLKCGIALTSANADGDYILWKFTR
jgi:predicted RecA/RadA family phage recombinase